MSGLAETVSCTQQDSIHAQTRQESTWPFGNIQIFTRFSLLVTKTGKLTADYLQTVSWNMVKAEVGCLGGGVCRSKVATASHRVPQGPRLGPLPGLCKALDCYWKRHLILLVEELHLVAQATEKLVHPTLLSVRELF